MERREHHIKVQRTARYYTSGELSENTKEIWIVLHGWAQLAYAFIKDFEALQNPNRFFIAPEALNRFYLKIGQPEVGTTWMTTENRILEINDYVNYLDVLYNELLRDKITTETKVTVLGFSQGATTLSRWLAETNNRIDRVVFYAGEPAIELQNEQGAKAFSRAENYYFIGTRDHIFTQERLSVFRPFLSNFQFVEYDGSHRISGEILQRAFG